MVFVPMLSVIILVPVTAFVARDELSRRVAIQPQEAKIFEYLRRASAAN